MKNNYSILITGSTGFIGRSLIKKLHKYYPIKNILCLVWNKDNETNLENRKILEKLHYPIKEIDLVTKEGLSHMPLKPKIVIHLAANTDTSSNDHLVDDLGTKNLIESLKDLGPNTHVIYTSTTAFFSGRKNCNSPLNENSLPVPSDKYGRSKLRAEKYLIKMCREKKFRLSIIRLGTVYGLDPRPKSMFKMINDSVPKKTIITRINWPGLTNIIYVEDVTDAIIKLATTKTSLPASPQIFVLYAENLTLSEICKKMYKAKNYHYSAIIIPKIIWTIFKIFRKIIPYSEPFLPKILYNPIWRFSLIVDNVAYVKSSR